MVTISSPANESVCSGDVSISIQASDSASGIQRVEIHIDGGLMLNDTSAPFSYSWDTTEVENGTHIILAIGYDNAGHNASTKHLVTVENAATTSTTTTGTTSTDTGTTGVPPPPDMLLLVVVAGVIGVVVVILVYMMVIRPRAQGT